MQRLGYIGRVVPRIDGIEKVTGRAIYAYDLELPHMLYAKVKRSTKPHARFRLDVSKALRLEGVRALITALDLPDRLRGKGIMDAPLLARGVVRYVGEPLAAVAAETPEVAEEALELIEVEYEELPAIFDAELAASKDPPVVVHPAMLSYERATESVYRALPDPERPNVNNHLHVRHGNVAEAFKEADLVVENTFTTSMVQHLHTEPNCAIAKPEPDGSVTLWCSTQLVYKIRREVCEALDLPPSKLRVIAVKNVGGGFGNKAASHIEALAVALALKSRRPVKIAMSREEVFACTTVRHPAVIRIKDGVKRDGRIIVREMQIYYNGGAYSIEGIPAVRNGVSASVSTYDIPNFSLDVYRVYTNRVEGGALRAFGGFQPIWAIESQMDIIARELGLDPVEFRLKNLQKEGSRNAIGEVVRRSTVGECLRRVAEALKWWEEGGRGKVEGPWRYGRGIAIAHKQSWADFPNIAYVRVKEDGGVELRTSVVDIGEGSYTVFAQILAEEFRLPFDKISILPADTASTPLSAGPAGSRQTFQTGNAIRRACEDAKRQLFSIASRRLDARPEDLDIMEGRIFVKDQPERSIEIGELHYAGPSGGAFVEDLGEIVGKGFWYERTGQLDPQTGQCSTDRSVAYYTPVAVGVELMVNVETGQVKVLRMIGAMDVGRAINPKLVEGQIEGGLSMGLGSALYEELILGDGKILNPDLKDYKAPYSLDHPTVMESIILESHFEEGPYGAKGSGEAPLLGPAPAIGNAIYDAVGIRIKDLPITAEKILKALKERRQPP